MRLVLNTFYFIIFLPLQIFESIRPKSTREEIRHISFQIAQIQGLNPYITQNSLFPHIIAYDKTAAVQQLSKQATEEANAAVAGGGGGGTGDGLGSHGAVVQHLQRSSEDISNLENTGCEQEEEDGSGIRLEEALITDDLEALLSPMRQHPATATTTAAVAAGINARAAAASPAVLIPDPTAANAQEVSTARRALLNDDFGDATVAAAVMETVGARAAGVSTIAKPATIAETSSLMQEEDVSASIGAMTAKEDELFRKLQALEAENAMLKTQQEGGRANGVAAQAVASKASLLHGLECVVNKTHLQKIDSELGNVHPHQQANYAIQKLAATGSFHYNNAVQNISAKNVGSGVPLSPGVAMVPYPLHHLPSQVPFNAAALGAMPSGVIAAATAAAVTAALHAVGGAAQYPLPFNAGFYPNKDANMVDAAAYGTEMATFVDPFASAGPRVNSAQGLAGEASKGSLPAKNKKQKQSRYKDLSPNGRDLPKWQDFMNVEALINWCFEPRIDVDGRELSVVELELEPSTGKKDTSWRSTGYRQRANELNYFWELAKEQLASKAAATSMAEMCTAAEELERQLGVKSVAQLMRVSRETIAARNKAGKEAAEAASN